MRRTVGVFALIILVIAGFKLASSTESSQPESADATEILQNAVFTDLDGGEVTIHDFEGKTVLIDIWETWCTPCIRSMPTLQELMDDYPDDFIVLAVSPGYMDSEEQVREFVANNDYDFAFVFGEQLAEDFNVQSIPYKVYVSPGGEYIESILGTQGPELDYEKTREIIEKHL